MLLGYRYDTHDRKQHRRVAMNPDGTSIMGATEGPGTFDLSTVSVGTSSAGAVFFPVQWLGVYDRQADINEIWNDLGRPEETILAFRDIETYKGTGYELDLTANPTRSWRLMFNYSIPKTQCSLNSSAGFRD